MTTIPYLKQYDDPITDYLKQYNKLLKQAYPNINELKNFLETNQHHEQTFGIKALELKYHAITTVPTTIEKTMDNRTQCKRNRKLSRYRKEHRPIIRRTVHTNIRLRNKSNLHHRHRNL